MEVSDLACDAETTLCLQCPVFGRTAWGPGHPQTHMQRDRVTFAYSCSNYLLGADSKFRAWAFKGGTSHHPTCSTVPWSRIGVAHRSRSPLTTLHSAAKSAVDKGAMQCNAARLQTRGGSPGRYFTCISSLKVQFLVHGLDFSREE